MSKGKSITAYHGKLRAAWFGKHLLLMISLCSFVSPCLGVGGLRFRHTHCSSHTSIKNDSTPPFHTKHYRSGDNLTSILISSSLIAPVTISISIFHLSDNTRYGRESLVALGLHFSSIIKKTEIVKRRQPQGNFNVCIILIRHIQGRPFFTFQRCLSICLNPKP